MALKVFKGTDFTEDLVTPDIHDAVIAEVLDLGYRRSRFEAGKVARQAAFILQVDEVREEGDYAGHPKEIWYFFYPDSGLGKKTNLYKFLSGAMGRDFTDEELDKIGHEGDGAGFDLEALAGRQLRVVVKHRKGEGANTRTKHTVESTLPKNADESKRVTVRDYTPVAQRENLDLDKAFGERVEPEQAQAEAAQRDKNDPVPF